jgi:hypothetical protein
VTGLKAARSMNVFSIMSCMTLYKVESSPNKGHTLYNIYTIIAALMKHCEHGQLSRNTYSASFE